MSEEPFGNTKAIAQATHAANSRHPLARNGRRLDPTTSDIKYTDADIEFMNAVHAYKLKTGRMFPTNHEILRILKGLGYQKIGMSA